MTPAAGKLAPMVVMSPQDLDSVVDRLLAAGCVAAEEEADDLIAVAPDRETLESWIARRTEGEPLAWITGHLEFCGRMIAVDPGVYVPRYQSEDLASRAATLLALSRARPARAVDLCTGSGAIATHLATVPDTSVIGVDLDPLAVACARRNGVAAVAGDLAALPLRQRAFDLVTAVAPYVPTDEMRFLPADVQRYEPRIALDGGSDGLDLVRLLVDAAARLLRPGGWLVTELGGDQDRALSPALAEAGFGDPLPWFDEDDDLRGLCARRDPT
jgi:release factor glutamine methyltransferase